MNKRHFIFHEYLLQKKQRCKMKDQKATCKKQESQANRTRSSSKQQQPTRQQLLKYSKSQLKVLKPFWRNPWGTLGKLFTIRIIYVYISIVPICKCGRHLSVVSVCTLTSSYSKFYIKVNKTESSSRMLMSLPSEELSIYWAKLSQIYILYLLVPWHCLIHPHITLKNVYLYSYLVYVRSKSDGLIDNAKEPGAYLNILQHHLTRQTPSGVLANI